MNDDKPARTTYVYEGETDGIRWRATLANYAGGSYVVDSVELYVRDASLPTLRPQEGSHATLNSAKLEVDKLVSEFAGARN